MSDYAHKNESVKEIRRFLGVILNLLKFGQSCPKFASRNKSSRQNDGRFILFLFLSSSKNNQHEKNYLFTNALRIWI